MKDILVKYIDHNKEKIIKLGTELFATPELGFKEFRTSDIAISYLKAAGISVHSELSITGFMAKIEGENKGPNICVLADLDAVPCSNNAVVHACAHSNQTTIMCAVMEALSTQDALSQFSGSVTFIATPAEEFVDFKYREQLIADSKIKYMSGKQDMISKGYFDDIDLIISCHGMGENGDFLADVNSSLTGFVKKTITYLGKASHAGAAPHLGINALNAAIIGLTAVNAQRETFLEEHNIRVHGIITNGGETINSVPEKTVIEAYVRGATVDSILDAEHKVNRAFEAGAYAVGGKCEIDTIPGYMPLEQCKDLSSVVKKNLEELVGACRVADGVKGFASGDVGDLSSIKPTIQFGFSGFSGQFHNSNFAIIDNETSYIMPIKAVLMTICDLLSNNAELAKKIIENYPCRLSKQKYLEYWLREK